MSIIPKRISGCTEGTHDPRKMGQKGIRKQKHIAQNGRCWCCLGKMAVKHGSKYPRSAAFCLDFNAPADVDDFDNTVAACEPCVASRERLFQLGVVLTGEQFRTLLRAGKVEQTAAQAAERRHGRREPRSAHDLNDMVDTGQ